MDQLTRWNLIINFGLPLVLLVGAYLTGTWVEKRHFASIRAREAACRDFPAISFATLPSEWQVERAGLVSGSTVVSLDYFKRVIAGLRGLFGGRLSTLEPLLERARREAVLRLIESAQSAGYDAVINVRLETSRLANARGGGQGTAGIEMLAFGTGIQLSPETG